MTIHTTAETIADALVVYGVPLASRLLLGTAQYTSPAVLEASVRASGTAVVTVSLRREAARKADGQVF
ncbi:MAG: thiazole synthase, partial [Pseudomonadota bacterium]